MLKCILSLVFIYTELSQLVRKGYSKEPSEKSEVGGESGRNVLGFYVFCI